MQALLATTFKLPSKEADKFILVSIAEDKMRAEFMQSVEQFVEMGYNLAGTPGTADYYSQRGIPITPLQKPGDGPESAAAGAAMVTEAAATAVVFETSGGEGGEGGKGGAAAAQGETALPLVLDWIRGKRIDLVINIPEGTTRSDEVSQCI